MKAAEEGGELGSKADWVTTAVMHASEKLDKTRQERDFAKLRCESLSVVRGSRGKKPSGIFSLACLHLAASHLKCGEERRALSLLVYNLENSLKEGEVYSSLESWMIIMASVGEWEIAQVLAEAGLLAVEVELDRVEGNAGAKVASRESRLAKLEDYISKGLQGPRREPSGRLLRVLEKVSECAPLPLDQRTFARGLKTLLSNLTKEPRLLFRSRNQYAGLVIRGYKAAMCFREAGNFCDSVLTEALQGGDYEKFRLFVCEALWLDRKCLDKPRLIDHLVRVAAVEDLRSGWELAAMLYGAVDPILANLWEEHNREFEKIFESIRAKFLTAAPEQSVARATLYYRGKRLRTDEAIDLSVKLKASAYWAECEDISTRFYTVGVFGEDEGKYQEAESAAREVLGLESDGWFEAAELLASFHHIRGGVGEALRIYEELEKTAGRLGWNHRRVLMLISKAALMLQAEKLPESEAHIDRALEAAVGVCTEEDWPVAFARTIRALILLRMARVAEAAQEVRAVLPTVKRLYPKTLAAVFGAMIEAIIGFQAGSGDECVRALDALVREGGPNWLMSEVVAELGIARLRLGWFEDAVAALRKSEELALEYCVASHPWLRRLWRTLVEAYEGAGQAEVAAAYRKKLVREVDAAGSVG